jgi:hypothetical protein
MESALADTHAEQYGATQFVCVAELDGRPDESSARIALRDLVRRHPLLRTDLHREDDRWWYAPTERDLLSPAADLPLVVLSTSDDYWADVADRRMDRPIATPGPLWEATLLIDPAGERSALVLAAHHAITDGVSLLALAGQFVEAHNRALAGASLDQPAFPRRGPIEALLASGGRGSPAPGATAELTAPGWAVEQAASVEQRSIRTHWHTLAPKQTAALLSRCRSAGTTANSAIVAALAVATQELPTHQDRLGCLLPISVRDQADPTVSAQENGCFIAEVSLTLGPADRIGDRWDRARQIRERYLRLRASALAAPTDFLNWPANEQPVGPTFRRGCLVTNLGWGRPPTEGGPLRLASFRFVVSPRHGSYAVSLSVATVGGRMVLGLSSVDPLLGEDSSAAVAAAFAAELTRPR